MNPRASLGALAVLLVLLSVPLLAPSAVPLSAAGGAVRSTAPLAGASTAPVQPLAASLSFALTSSAAIADPKDTVVFTVYYNNTGTQAAPDVWINVSAAIGLTFLGDNAAGNVSGFPAYHFTNVPLGLHAFRMNDRVDVGTPPGTRLAVSATLVYADGSGGQQFLGPALASVLVGVVQKPLYLGPGSLPSGSLSPVAPTGTLTPQGTFSLGVGGPSVNFDLTRPLVRSFHALNATAVLYLQPLTSPSALDINLTLIDVNGASTTPVSSVERTTTITGSGYWTLYYVFPAMNAVFAAGHQIRLQILNTASSAQPALLATNATTTASRLILQTTSYVTITALRPDLLPPTYLSPNSALVVSANISDPFGSSEVVEAHLNVTGPTGVWSGWTDPFPVVARDSSTPSAWVLYQRTFSPPLANGTYHVEATAVERNGVMDIEDGQASVVAPALTLQKVASPTRGKGGTRITYFLWYNNTGTATAATVWLNDTLPTQVFYLNSSVAPSSVTGNAYSWVFNSVPVGPHVLQIFVFVRFGLSGVAYIRNWASVNFTDLQGFPWPSVRSHADVVVNGPVLALSQAATASGTVHSNEPVLVSIHLTNTGDAANGIWLNDTVPAGLTYFSDTADAEGGNRTIAGNVIHWTFPGMASGTTTPVFLNFTMSVVAAAGLSRGTILANVIGLNDTSANGLLMPDQVSRLPLTVASPWIATAAAAFEVASAVPRVALPFEVNFTNSGNEAAGLTLINLTLSPSLRFVSATVPAAFSSPVLQLTLANVSVGPQSIGVVLSAFSSVTDGQVLTVSGTLETQDGFGNLLPAVPVAPGRVSVALPAISFSLSPTSTRAEAGTQIPYILTGGNSGHGTASAVWLNLTLPAGLSYVNDTFGAPLSVLGSSYSWVWRGYAPGPRTYGLVLAADPTAPDNATLAFSVTIQAFDAGGSPRPVMGFPGRVGIIAPAFRLSVWADHNTTQAGQTFTLTLIATNDGSTAAQTLWLTDAIDSHIALISYDAPVPASGTTTLNWTFAEVAPGRTIAISLLVRVADGTPGNTQLSNVLVAHYTNSAGTVLGYAQSSPAIVPVQASLLPLDYIVVGGTGLGAIAVFVVYRRYRVRIEDVFLIYRDGILVSHLTEGNRLEKDEDQLSGMLTAVQDFVKDAFTYGEHRELHQLEFGDYHILIERGKVVYLAVVYQGRDSGLIRKRVRTVLDRVESAYGRVFERWDGDMSEVTGTQGLLREGFIEDRRPWSLVKSRPN